MTSDDCAKDLILKFGVPTDRETLENLLKISYARGEREGLNQGMVMGQRTMESALGAIQRALG